MKSSRRLLSMLTCAAIGFMAFVSSAVGALAHAVVATYRAAKNLVLGGFELAAGDFTAKNRALIAFVQARSFVLRLAKRERPEVSGSWRMCPST